MLIKQEKQILGIVDGEEAEIEYSCTPFPAMKGIRLSIKIAKAFGGGIGKAAKGGLANMGDMDVSEVVDKILENLDEEDTPKLIIALLAKTQRNGVFLDQTAFDKVFAANYFEIFDALKFVFEVNFGGFFNALTIAKGNIGNAQPPQSVAKK